MLHMQSLKAFMHLVFRGNIYQLTPPDPPLSLKIHDPPSDGQILRPPSVKFSLLTYVKGYHLKDICRL